MPYERSLDGGKSWQPISRETLRTIDKIAHVDHDHTLINLDAGHELDLREFGYVRKIKETPKPAKQPAKPTLSLF